jgi:hypothetical protein
MGSGVGECRCDRLQHVGRRRQIRRPQGQIDNRLARNAGRGLSPIHIGKDIGLEGPHPLGNLHNKI